ncbi:hypothetical protein GH714_007054 [Hevea brasiliensis]|uniref:Uncharacterized protein n=1 Tax=Hevea brasiliensis TaxID=3981 RepID=A0A6A6KHI6_HEVBR|nr:hypothetical protein GH714_007054 [Hevea brasiliensis]
MGVCFSVCTEAHSFLPSAPETPIVAFILVVNRWAARVLVSSDDACGHGRKEVGLPSQVAKFSKVTEINGPSAINICNINLATVVPGLKLDKRMGPAIKMSLPSFSGRTKHNPNLLKYSCNIECRVRAVQPAKVSRLFPASKHDTEESLGHHKCKSGDAINGELLDYGQSLSISVMLSKPILALQFSCLKMQVEAPIAVSHCSKSSCRTSLGFLD